MDYQPLQIAVYDKSYAFKGYVALPTSVTVTQRFLQASDCTFTVDADINRVGDLATEGARCVVTYRWRDDVESQVLISGNVEEVTGENPGAQATRTFTVSDDFNWFFQMLAWPTPGNDVLHQDETGYYTQSGPAETVVKTTTLAAATRLGVPLTVPSSAGLGSTMKLSARMDLLSDLFFPTVEQYGIGVRIRQLGSTPTLEVWQPSTYPRTLTEESGIVVDGSFTIDPPKVTRVIVGGGGEDVARNFRQYVNTDAESAYGFKREIFVDARDLQPTMDAPNPDDPPVTNPDFETDMAQRGQENLDENAGTVGLDVTLSESDTFQFGNAFNIGDTVSVQLAGSPVLTDKVREVEVAWSNDDGLLVTPKIGSWDSSADATILDVVAKTAKGLRSLQKRY